MGEFQAEDYLPGPLPLGAPTPPALRAVREREILGGSYRLVRLLGQGGTGVVFEASDEKLGRRVAVKVLNPVRALVGPYREILIKESVLLAKLNHPGIVPVHAFETDPASGVDFLVMDLVEGESLDRVVSHLAKKGIEGLEEHELAELVGMPDVSSGRSSLLEDSWPRTAVRIVREIVRTLEATHDQGVVHRDLTPGNVVLGRGGWPVLLDFGLGGHLESDPGAITQGLYGTPAYLAPEQLDAQQTGVNPQTDIYQAGLLLYELLTLRRAFDKGTHQIMAILADVRAGAFPRPRTVNTKVPRALEAVVLRALENAPDRRYRSAREFGLDLDRWLDGLAPRAGGVNALGRTSGELRRLARAFPRSFGALASGLLGVVFLTVFLWTRSQSLIQMETIWRLAPGDSQARPISPGSPLSEEDWLGTIVNSHIPAYVYAISITGGPREQSQYILPVREPLALEALLDDGNLPTGVESIGPWGLRVPPGETHVAFVAVGPERGEGLLTFAAPDRVHVLETWFQRIEQAFDLHYSEAGFPGVPRPEAERLFPDPAEDFQRGEPISALVPEVRRVHLSRFDASSILQGTDWQAELLGARLEFWSPVETP